ncbi:MAG: hypothetical protein HYV63_25010 [Candidatus Schekmanbacteria bacterium]|nr:hypothetical protein [Candidatus Schekmanbacteria bacterium]
MVYAKLLAVLIQHGCIVIAIRGCGDPSLVTAAQTVRRFAMALASGCKEDGSLTVALEHPASAWQWAAGSTVEERHPTSTNISQRPARIDSSKKGARHPVVMRCLGHAVQTAPGDPWVAFATGERVAGPPRIAAVRPDGIQLR